MPQIDFDPNNKVQSQSEYPRLKLEMNEKARVFAGLENPTFAFVHELRAPKIVNGKAAMVEKARKDKTTYVDYDMDFIGRPMCLGELGLVMDKGVDTKNCPMCDQATKTDQVDKPKRRFAMHVIKYGVKPNSFDLINPFSCQLVVWGFTEGIYGKLADFAHEWGPLSTHDLKLGPCENKNWQRFEIQLTQTPAFHGDEVMKKTILDTFHENRVDDLESFCGRKAQRKYVESDLEAIADRWRIALGTAPAPDGTEGSESSSLTEGLEGLMSTPPAASSPGVDMSELVGKNPTPATDGEPKAAAPVDDFTSLLSKL